MHIKQKSGCKGQEEGESSRPSGNYRVEFAKTDRAVQLARTQITSKYFNQKRVFVWRNNTRQRWRTSGMSKEAWERKWRNRKKRKTCSSGPGRA